ncbi:PREDICTED: LEM domain-containing protein 1 isoform X1 [Rhinopithecus bieti]|uniref:LEM domain-containing protein 1 isoform X1 n=2 Tax=Rhinopithecus bieti TaxID=61621 RepID=UPI00083C4A88|nr:PREDICTED: LEM domain-containing protein 1 isoform X1 [Rhinopithecus bieti]
MPLILLMPTPISFQFSDLLGERPQPHKGEPQDLPHAFQRLRSPREAKGRNFFPALRASGDSSQGFYHQKRGQTSITMVDVKCLSDCKLQNQLEKLGFSPGPILPSTRKLYEKKLVQLLVSPPCAPPVMNGPRELDGAQDSDDSEELNIILQGNIILSTEKSKKLKKVVSPSSFQSRIYKWPEASTTKPKAVDTYCLDYKPSKGRRWAAKAPSTRITYGTITKERGYCAEDQTIESWKEEGFPVGLKLAVLGVSLQPAVSASQAPFQLLSQNLHFNRIPGDSYPN